MNINEITTNSKFNFLADAQKQFITQFSEAMNGIGYENDGVQDYVVFGKYKIEYYKAGVKTKKFIARIYLRDGDAKIAERWGGNGLGIVLRLYFTNIDKQRAYIENAPEFIKTPFVDNHSLCHGCKAKCSRRKIYTIDGKQYVKCTDSAFLFEKPETHEVAEYIKLLTAFYPTR